MPNPKPTLLAHLASQRARAWQSVLALPAQTLASDAVHDGWTPKDILAHLAYWDGTRAEQLTEMLAGRSAEVDFTHGTPEFNARLYAERRDWPLQRAVEELQAARGRFMAIIEPLGEGDLSREFPLRTGERVTVEAWIMRRYRHDDAHVEPIEAWRAGREPAPGPKSILSVAVASAHAALLSWQDVFPVHEPFPHPICGEPAWQGLLGHLADWQRYCLQGLRGAAQGQPVDSLPGDCQRWRAPETSDRLAEPFERTRADFTAAHQELLDLLAGLDERALGEPIEPVVPDIATRYAWFATCALHDWQHARALEEAAGGIE